MKPHLSSPNLCCSAPLGSPGCSGSPPLLCIVTYWIDLLGRVFRRKTKRGSHGWPISAFLFNSVVKHCWLTVSTVYKKVLCKKSPFSHRPVWHQCWADLLLKGSLLSFVTALYEFPWQPVWAAPNQKYLAGGKSVCRHVFLFNEFSGWSVCSACRCHFGSRQLGDAVCPFSLLPQAERPMRRLPLHDCQLSWGCRTHHDNFSWYPESLVFYWEWSVQQTQSLSWIPWISANFRIS